MSETRFSLRSGQREAPQAFLWKAGGVGNEEGAVPPARARAPPPAAGRRRGRRGGVGRVVRATGGAAASAAASCLAIGCVFLGGSGVGVGVARADDGLNVAVADAFDFTKKQLTVLSQDVLTRKGLFTDYTDADGEWITTKSDGDPIDKEVWTSGMVAGMFWYQYEATKDPAMKTAAEFYCTGLEGVEVLDDNDLGFQVLNSYGLGYRLSGSPSIREEYLERVLTAAQSLYDFKWDGNIPAFWAWANPKSMPEWDRAVNIDMIMNMEIMLWAKANGGEDHDDDVAAHADTTWRDIVRSDNSTYHVADYDIDTGALVDKGTYQGWAAESTWSRGQAWAVYGYAMIYRFLAEPRFLDWSLGVLSYWEANLPADYVAPVDFDENAPAADNGKDSSATAIVASALLELFLITGDPIYLTKGQTYLSALLQADYYLPNADDGYQSILRRTTGAWGDPEVGSVFGDYFLLETMVRYKKLAPSILLWRESGEKVVAAASRRRLQATQAEAQALLSELGEELEAEAGESRRLQEVIPGGTFCALSVSGGALVLADAGCVPVPPDFSALEPATTSAPTPSPTAASRGGGVIAVAPTIAPTTLGALSPAQTSAPTPMDSSPPAASAASITFGSRSLDNDVDLSFLDETSPVVVRLSVTLDNISSAPSSLSLVNSGGDILEFPITPPAGGWKRGSNSVSFEVDVTSFAPAAWTEVSRVVLGFAASPTAAAAAATVATVDWLVISNKLIL